MGPAELSFEWARDAKGYQLTPEKPQWVVRVSQLLFPASGLLGPEALLEFLDPKPGSFFSSVKIPEGFPQLPMPADKQSQYIVRNGGSLVPYRADQSLDRIFEDFINAKGDASIQEFYNRWGPLGPLININIPGGSELVAGEEVSEVKSSITKMNKLIDVWAEADEAKQKRLIEVLLGADGLMVCSLDFVLEFDPRTRAPRTQIRVRSLFAALWMKMIEQLTGDTVLRRCLHCDALFTAGRDSERRRLDTKFCSDHHRILYHRLKNAPPPEPEPEPGQPRRRGRPRRAVAA
jgi:hypothetical protein